MKRLNLLPWFILFTLLAAQIVSPPVQASAPEERAAPPVLPAPVELAAAAIPADFRVQAMMNQVQSATLYNYVADLSGARAATIGGQAYTITTRNTNAEASITKVTQYAYEHFQAMGLAVSYHSYPYNGGTRRNVVAEQPGASTTCVYVLVAHLDNMPSAGTAPGADDNASGSAGVLATADILSQQHFVCGLRYVLVTGEEQGLYGSLAYAADAKDLSVPIKGALDLDMIGYNTPGTAATFELDIRPGAVGAQDQQLVNTIGAVSTTYQLGLTPQVVYSNAADSDHYSFWAAGFPAVLVIEDWNDHTPYYHTSSDTLASLNMDYMTAFTRLMLGTAAHLAQLDPALRQVFLPILTR